MFEIGQIVYHWSDSEQIDPAKVIRSNRRSTEVIFEGDNVNAIFNTEDVEAGR